MRILILLLLSLVCNQAQSIEVKIIDKYNAPVEGVYAQVNNNKVFLFSDSLGIIKIPDKDYNLNDSITFSHLSFKTKKFSIANFIQPKGDTSILILESDIKQLDEITIQSIDEKSYIKNAIELIPENFESPYTAGLYLDADISLFNNVDNTELIKYKGAIVLTKNSKDIYVSKLPEEERIVDNLRDYIYYIKPYNFTTIISITSHPVISKYNDFSFYKHEYVQYKDIDAIKIYFKIDRKYGGQSGYLIINSEDKAIMSLSYKINPIKDWVGEKTKKGIVKTSLMDYYVEANYSKGNLGKYMFDSGREKIILNNNVGKDNNINTISETYLKRQLREINPTTKVKLKELFEK